MSNAGTYIFSRPGYGSLELEVSAPSKQVYGSQASDDAVKPTTSGLYGHPSNPEGPICFFEWQKIRYEYLIEAANEQFTGPFALKINDRIEKRTKEPKNGVYVLSGDLSFKDQVGDTTLEIVDANNNQIFALATEVFPQKMDYKSDYRAMMGEISQIVENLAFDSLKDTFRKSRARLSGQATYNEWWNILDALFDQLMINLGVIKRQPKHEIKTQEHVLPVDKIKHASKRNIEWLRKNKQYTNQKDLGIKLIDNNFASHALSCKKYVTYDTYENRFVAWAIRTSLDKLRRYKRYIETTQGDNDFSPLLNRMKSHQSKLQAILHESPFNEVGQFEKRSYFSTSLTRGAGYRDFMHIHLLLSRGLEIANNDIFKIEQKDLSTLYEYWCFLKLVQLLKEQNACDIDYQHLIKIDANGFHVNLRKGEPSKVVFKNEQSNEATTIYFNREFTTRSGKSFTYNQRPDYTLKFQKRGYDQPFWYLFDAKYRFDEQSESAGNQYNVPQDAIGQLHRYRDAILHTSATNTSYRGAIKNLGGIILYPYPLSESTFVGNDYHKSIDSVNIGALPFLPSKTALVRRFLQNLINKTADGHFEDFIEMDRSEYEKKRGLWDEYVTIGVIPTKYQEDRLMFLRNKLLYHIPFVKDVNSRLYSSKKILVCLSGKNDATLYDVTSWEILTNEELRRSGTTWDHKNEKYIAFHLANGEQLETPEKLSSLGGYRYATSEGIRRYLNDQTRDRRLFYLTNPDAARLYEELVNKNVPFEINWAKDSKDPSLIEFTVGEKKILSSGTFKFLTFTLNNKSISLNDLLALCTT